MYGIINAAAVPNNDQIWLECEYLGSSATPIGSFINNSKANNLASGVGLTADTSAWDSNVSARLNSHAYTSGQTMTVGDGRVYFCTTSGTSNSSLPAGYASNTDGGSVTDGTAHFRAGCRFSMSNTFTPALAGQINCKVKAAQASTTFYT